MTQRLLDLFQNAGDQNLGQTLLRLARLAEDRHRFEQAAAIAQDSSHAQHRIDGVGSWFTSAGTDACDSSSSADVRAMVPATSSKTELPGAGVNS